jgi:putative membrane protein
MIELDPQPQPRRAPQTSILRLVYTLLASAASIYVADYLLDNIIVTDFWGAMWVALLLGLLNALLKPLLMLISLPLIVLTFGLFLFVINAIMLMVVSDLSDVIEVKGFWTAVLGSFIITIMTYILNPPRNKNQGGPGGIHFNIKVDRPE